MKRVSQLFLGAALVAIPVQRLAVAADAAEPAEKGVASDLATLRTRAERGDALAQYNLGIAFAEGRQTPIDPIEALVWLTLASERGNTAKELATLLVSLSSDQITAAGRRLESIRASNPNLRPAATVRAGVGSPAPTPPGSMTASPATAGAKAPDGDVRSPGPEKVPSPVGDELPAAKTASFIIKLETPAEESRLPASAPSDSELNSLRSQVRILERDLRNATAALQRVAAENTTAASTLTATNQQLAAAMKELNSPRRHDADSSRTLSASAEQEPSVLKPEVSDTRSRPTGAEKQIAASEVEIAWRARDEAQRQLAGMTEELAKARKQVAAAGELESRLGQLEAEKTNLLSRTVEAGTSKEELARVLAAQVEVERKLSVALRSYTLLTQERDELRVQVSAARELESRVRQLEAEKARLHDGGLYVSRGEYARVVAAQAEAENKLSTTLRAFTLLTKERDELRAQIAERSK